MNRAVARGGAILVGLFVLVGCSGTEEAGGRSISEIHESEGVPVNIRPVEETEFRTYLRFTATLRGAEESAATSMLADEVASVRFQVGEYVEQGTPVVLFPSDNPSLNYEQSRVSYESARQAFERVSKLYEEDGVSRQSFDDARTQFEIARANWESVRSMAQVAAPISGYITRINVSESDNVNPGDPLFTISSFEELKSTVWLTDRQVAQVRGGQLAGAEWQEHRLPGEVVQVDMAMDQERKAFAAKLRFENPDLRVRSGVTATVEIVTHRDQALIVSEPEVREDAEGPYVYLFDGERAERRRITVGRRQGLYLEVAEGLDPGDRLVTKGIDQVTEGALLRVIEEEPRLVQR
ncbi:MAG: efflux RND transporter periplasmic adaptor subunit [Spirochaetaceae bacterium]